MAGFFPHIGKSSAGGFTPLPTTTISGILDSIVTDIGAGVNGWTLHDDLRTVGSSYPWVVYLFNNGRYTNSTTSINQAWTFTNGSPYTWGDLQYGYHYAATISSAESSMSGILPTASLPQISVDNVNWYRAGYTSWGANNKVTATLDRNFAQSTTSTRDLLCRLERWIVLKCTSTTKTFYVAIGQMPMTTFLYVQTFEDWNTTTHTGINGGQIEICRGGFWDNRANIQPTYTCNVEVQYVLCLYPEAIFFWIKENYIYPIQAGLPVEIATAFYAGNLDTTGLKDSDPDAVWFGCSDTSYTGMRCTGGVDHATSWTQWGSSQCLRTSNGNIWQAWNSYHAWAPKDNCYQFVPRGRPYTRNLGATPVVSNNSYYQMLDVDIYQAGLNDADQTNLGQDMCSEGRRGSVRYLKVPAFNPTGLHLCTFGPAQDGYTYMMLLCGYPLKGAAGTIDGGYASAYTVDVNGNNVPSSFADSNGPTGAGNRYDSTFGDIISSAGIHTSNYRYLLIPMIGTS